MKPIVVTVGMGIGPEVCVKSLESFTVPTLLLAKRGTLVTALQNEGKDWTYLWKFPHVQIVELEDDLEPAEVQAIRMACHMCLTEQASAMVTGPINKAKLMEKGFSFPGHTGFLGHLCGIDRPVIAFSVGQFQVVLITTHIPLMKVPSQLNTADIIQVVRVAHEAWLQRGHTVRFGVCGVNPHAGEQGQLGREEIDIIQPACEKLRHLGIDVTNVISSETAFLMARDNKVDVVVAMYHDQGLTPLKLVDFGQSVNWTLGLPIIRTSVDHGTADGIVGMNKANPASLQAAWSLALEIAQSNRT